MRIDAHQHFWKFDPIRDAWIGENMQVIRRDFLAPDLCPFLEDQAMDGCIAVQADQSLAENAFLLEQAAAHPFVKGVVGWVDFQADDIEDRLAYYRGFPLMKGFRHILQGEAQRDFMLRPSFMRGIGLLNRYGYTYDVLIFQDQLDYALEFVRRFPDQPFVVDHLAKPGIKEHASSNGNISSLESWSGKLKALAACDNVWCKVSGMVTEADWASWKAADFRPFLDVAVEAFGTSRLMFGSDWPVCLLAASYEETARIVNDYFAAFSPAERLELFGGNAASFYHIN